MRSHLAIVLLALALAGCARTSGVMLAAQPGLAACADLSYTAPGERGQPVERKITDRNGEPTGFLVSSLVVGLTSDPSRDAAPDPFDAWLDCLIGEVDGRDPEKRLLRGHVLVTMLAMYGDFNLRRRQAADLQDDAALIIQGIENAELNLASGSGIILAAALGPSAHPEHLLTSYARVARVVDVLQVAIDVERPTRARLLGSLRNAAAVVAGNAALADLLLDGLRGIRKAAILEVYGGALRNDARRFLRGLEGRSITLADWQAWDRWLDRACASIAAIGGVSNRCVPGVAALASYLDAGAPPSRIAPGAQAALVMP